jgi:hypothetical protein
VLSSIPLVKVLNCCFCLLNLVGVGIGIGMHLKQNPTDKLNAGEAAAAGAISGALAGLISSIASLIMNLIVGSMMYRMYSSFPREMRDAMGMMMGGGILGIPLGIMMYAAIGALGGFLAMQLFWKDRLAS